MGIKIWHLSYRVVCLYHKTKTTETMKPAYKRGDRQHVESKDGAVIPVVIIKYYYDAIYGEYVYTVDGWPSPLLESYIH